jgi:hypothetical protein
MLGNLMTPILIQCWCWSWIRILARVAYLYLEVTSYHVLNCAKFLKVNLSEPFTMYDGNNSLRCFGYYFVNMLVELQYQWNSPSDLWTIYVYVTGP